MKKAKIVTLTLLISLCAFAAIIDSSCKKNLCSGVNCDNGGSCSQGTCICPTGYSGVFCQSSSIIFVNDTYTPVNISINGVAATIGVGGSVSFTGLSGDPAAVNASTTGTSSSGTYIGHFMTWSFSYAFPSGGIILTQPIDVSPAYFYLKIVNKSTEAITDVYVNSGNIADSTLDTLTIPADGAIHGIGYYAVNTNTEVYLTGTGTKTWLYNPITIHDTTDASVTLFAN